MTTLNRADFVRLGSMFAGSLVLGVSASGCANQSHGAELA